MRKVLDLFANVRPVRVPAEGIDWMFFRENTEDLYAVGSEGFSIGDLNIDFKILSNPGSERSSGRPSNTHRPMARSPSPS